MNKEESVEKPISKQTQDHLGVHNHTQSEQRLTNKKKLYSSKNLIQSFEYEHDLKSGKSHLSLSLERLSEFEKSSSNPLRNSNREYKT